MHISSLESFYLPLPKMTEAQRGVLSANLRSRGFEVRSGGSQRRQLVTRGSLSISIDGRLGLARAGRDLLDAIAPAIPDVLAATRPGEGGDEDVAKRYFSLSASGSTTRLQFFPRMESLSTWTGLRREGLCGLTPDEAAILAQLLKGASSEARVECVAARPSDGSKIIQMGRRQYFSTSLPVPEFLSSLATIESRDLSSASFLPRASTVVLHGSRVSARIKADELVEWCFLG